MQNFWDGFEKQAKLKNLLMAGMMAGTPMKAIAGEVAKKLPTKTVKQLHKARKAVDKVKDVAQQLEDISHGRVK